MKDQMTYNTIKVHICDIRQGDTILHDNVLKTVCRNNIKNGFCGRTIFGDSYKSGTILVVKIYNLKY